MPTGWSLQILFLDYNFSGSASKDGSIFTHGGHLPYIKGKGLLRAYGFGQVLKRSLRTFYICL